MRKRLVLDEDRAIHGEKKGKKVKFVPARIPQLNSEEELEEGQIIGVLENELEGEETKLPMGKHNIFVAKVNGEWKGYAESNGEIVAEAARVKIEHHQWGKHKTGKPEFKEEGWCLVNVCLVSVWIFCLVSVGFICF